GREERAKHARRVGGTRGPFFCGARRPGEGAPRRRPRRGQARLPPRAGEPTRHRGGGRGPERPGGHRAGPQAAPGPGAHGRRHARHGWHRGDPQAKGGDAGRVRPDVHLPRGARVPARGHRSWGGRLRPQGRACLAAHRRDTQGLGGRFPARPGAGRPAHPGPLGEEGRGR
ncbi:MAG: Two-component transcriptional response regulator, LuxR family, partial [uncultured Rubrobacteraceae bacterium]